MQWNSFSLSVVQIHVNPSRQRHGQPSALQSTGTPLPVIWNYRLIGNNRWSLISIWLDSYQAQFETDVLVFLKKWVMSVCVCSIVILVSQKEEGHTEMSAWKNSLVELSLSLSFSLSLSVCLFPNVLHCLLRTQLCKDVWQGTSPFQCEKTTTIHLEGVFIWI